MLHIEVGKAAFFVAPFGTFDILANERIPPTIRLRLWAYSIGWDGVRGFECQNIYK